MIIAHAAGVAAALTVRHKVPIGQVSIPELEKRLLEERAVLSHSS